jgi:hypothetical protein
MDARWSMLTADGRTVQYDFLRTLAGTRANGVHAVRQVHASRKRLHPVRRLYTSTSATEEAAFQALATSAVDGYRVGEFARVLDSGPGWFVLDAPPGTTLSELWDKCGGHMPAALIGRIGRQGRRLIRKTHAVGYLIRNLSLESFVYRGNRLALVDLFMHKLIRNSRDRARYGGGWVNDFSSPHAMHYEPNAADDYVAFENMLAALRVGATPTPPKAPTPWRQERLLVHPTTEWSVTVHAAVGPGGARRRMYTGPGAERALDTLRTLHDADPDLFPPVVAGCILDCPIGHTLEEARAAGAAIPVMQGVVLLARVHAAGYVLRNVSATSYALHNGRLYLVDVSTAKLACARDVAKARRLTATTLPWINAFSTQRVREGYGPSAQDDLAAFRAVMKYAGGAVLGPVGAVAVTVEDEEDDAAASKAPAQPMTFTERCAFAATFVLMCLWLAASVAAVTYAANRPRLDL